MGARFKNLQQELTKVLKDGDVITGILEVDGERKPILDEAAKMLEGLLKARKASAERARWIPLSSVQEDDAWSCMNPFLVSNKIVYHGIFKPFMVASLMYI